MPRHLLPRHLRVGRIDASTLPAADRDLGVLLERYRREGLFQYKTRWLVVDVVRALVLFALGLFVARSHLALGAGILTLAHLNVMWWVHDACHDSVFADPQSARRWGQFASLAFVGTPVRDYQFRTHRIHHAFTNVIGGDHALETGPFVWDKRMLPRTSPTFVRHQAWLWFVLVLPLTYVLFFATAIHQCAKARQGWPIALTALRWTVVIGVAVATSQPLLSVTLPVFAAAYLLALISGLNHFHLPMGAVLDGSFARASTTVTQNMVETNPIVTWLVGGLNFHIEHHLFATMPRHNYRVIAGDVRALCRAHGLPYNTCTVVEAIEQLVHKLRDPFDAPPRPTSPSFSERPSASGS